MSTQQIYNPFLPAYEYIPDGEPHVFGDRVYLFGSHDRFDGNRFCMNDYVCYSADVHNLKTWRYEGVIYQREQDPRNVNNDHYLWAPDVTKGPDGRYYLYYCLDHLPQMAVAVCDTPAGKYEYLGLVRYADRTPLGERDGDFMQFDPGVFVDDDGTIYLYSGMAPRMESQRGQQSLNSQVMTLESDMMTIKSEPKVLLPTIFTSTNSDFKGHEFFEASSMRKVNRQYYFVYSSVESHELCYCISDKPDSGFRYGGTIVSIGDIGLDERGYENSLNFWGNTHGGMEYIDGQWYIFYHRQTNRTQFSRQACAERILILPDGSIPQVEITSCGLNGGPLEGKGTYEARIACNLLGEDGTVMSRKEDQTEAYPFFTQDGMDYNPNTEGVAPIQYIANMRNGSAAGYKYFDFKDVKEISVKVRSCDICGTNGVLQISNKLHGDVCGSVSINLDGCEDRGIWKEFCGRLNMPNGVSALFLEYRGEGAIDFLSFTLKTDW